MKNNKNLSVKKRELHSMDFPLNLLTAILEGSTMNAPEITDDVMRGLEQALSNLTERQYMVIIGRYRDKCTANEIAEKLSISPNRVHQIEREAIRHLHYRYILGYIIYGAEGFRKRSYRFKFCDIDKYTKEELMSMYLCSIGFTKHTYTCLSHAGYRYVRDITDISMEAIMSILNLGTKNREEIAILLESYGLSDTVWKAFIPFSNGSSVMYDEPRCKQVSKNTANRNLQYTKDDVRTTISKVVDFINRNPIDGINKTEYEQRLTLLMTDENLDTLALIFTVIHREQINI